MDIIPISAYIVHETEKALMVKLEVENGNKQWIPKSLIHNWEDVKYLIDVLDDAELKLEEIEMELPKWFLDKEGIDYGI